MGVPHKKKKKVLYNVEMVYEASRNFILCHIHSWFSIGSHIGLNLFSGSIGTKSMQNNISI